MRAGGAGAHTDSGESSGDEDAAEDSRAGFAVAWRSDEEADRSEDGSDGEDPDTAGQCMRSVAYHVPRTPVMKQGRACVAVDPSRRLEDLSESEFEGASDDEELQSLITCELYTAPQLHCSADSKCCPQRARLAFHESAANGWTPKQLP